MKKQADITRLYFLDNGSGILIAFIVLFYHLPVYCSLDKSAFFLSLRTVLDFFMAWFFFKSGMFHKQREPIIEFKKCWRRLLLPYLVINICCLALHIVFFRGDASVSEIIKVAIYNECEDLCYPLWFCLSLAIVRIAYQLLTGNGRINKWLVICLALSIAFLMYLYSYRLGDVNAFKRLLPITIPYWFGNIFLGLFFYGLGDLLRKKQFNRYLFVGALFIYIAHFFFPIFLNLWYNLSDYYFLSVLYYISGIIVFNNVLRRYLDKCIPVLSHVGENSMIYYITHGTFYELLFILVPFKTSAGWLLYIETFIVTIVFLYLMDKLFRKNMLLTP